MPSIPRLRVVTERCDAGALLERASAAAPLAFVRSGDGIVGRGEAWRVETTGPSRMRDAAAAWAALVALAEVDDAVDEHGTGLVAFGAFAFSPRSAAASTLVVPRVVWGRRGDDAWVTRIAPVDAPLPEVPAASAIDDVRVELAPGRIDGDAYAAIVGEGIRRIRGGEVEKVVLARDLAGRMPTGGDVRSALLGLSRRYPDAITYAVDGLIGATPETLVAARERRFFTRVLAGTAARGATPALDGAIAEQLVESRKDRDEHAFAADSAMAVLRHLSPDATASEPFPLRMPNVWHLATDITGTLPAASTLDVIDALHPTAAVAGTPRGASMLLIEQLEGVDRRRYAGPVGWVDAAGGGEWAIALRGAEIEGDGTIRAFAGAGIVAESDPAAELAETRIKFRPIVDALQDPLP